MSATRLPQKTKNKKQGLLYIALFMACITLSLGIWQLYRLQWKLDLIEQRELALALPALDEDELLAEPQDKSLVFRHVQLSGVFDPSKEIWIYPRTLTGKIGHIVYTAFKTKTGHWFLVQRGWVPNNQNTSVLSNSFSPITINGVLISSPQHKFSLSTREKVQKQWPWLDFNALSQRWHITWATPLIVALEKADPPLVALGAGPSYRNMHLMYALTWFTLSFVLLIFYFSYRKN